MLIQVSEKDVRCEVTLLEENVKGWVAKVSVHFGELMTVLGFRVGKSDRPGPGGELLWVAPACYLNGGFKPVVMLHSSIREKFETLVIEAYKAKLEEKSEINDDVEF